MMRWKETGSEVDKFSVSNYVVFPYCTITEFPTTNRYNTNKGTKKLVSDSLRLVYFAVRLCNIQSSPIRKVHSLRMRSAHCITPSHMLFRFTVLKRVY